MRLIMETALRVIVNVTVVKFKMENLFVLPVKIPTTSMLMVFA